MHIVLDTNVIVSGLLNPYGDSAAILKLIIMKKVKIVLDSRILAEYNEVLKRPKFHFLESEVNDILIAIKNNSILSSSIPLKISLPDPDDEQFLEVGISSKAEYLITWNLKHYPKKTYSNISIITPRQFIEVYKNMSYKKDI